MSNTDGEETNIDMLTRRVINHLNDYAIKGVLVREDVNNMVIESRLAQKELASLREQLKILTDKLRLSDKNCELLRGHRDELQNQLKQKEETINSHKAIIDKLAYEETDTVNSLRDIIKQKEDENRELVNFLLAIPIDPVYWVEYDSLIRKHKKNLSA